MRSILLWGILIAIILCFWIVSVARGDSLEHHIPRIIQVESSGNPSAVGENGEIGLMQIMPIVYKEYIDFYYPKGHYESYFVGKKDRLKWQREANLKDPKINVAIGTWYLNRLKDHYIPKNKYSNEVLLGAWNWGIGNVRSVDYDYNRFPRQVRAYIQKVLR